MRKLFLVLATVILTIFIAVSCAQPDVIVFKNIPNNFVGIWLDSEENTGFRFTKDDILIINNYSEKDIKSLKLTSTSGNYVNNSFLVSGQLNYVFRLVDKEGSILLSVDAYNTQSSTGTSNNYFKVLD